MDTREISILFADDDDNIRGIAEHFLANLGYTVTTVPDGAQAVGKFARLEFDICVLDVHMPHINGLEVVGAIREIHPECRILFVTGAANEEEIRRIYKDHMGIAVIRKPFKLDVLRKYIEMLAGSIEIDRKERSHAAKVEAQIAALSPIDRFIYHSKSATRKMHESFVLYTIIAALFASFSIVSTIDHFYSADRGAGRSLQDMYGNVMTVLERWEKEDTRRDGR